MRTRRAPHSRGQRIGPDSRLRQPARLGRRRFRVRAAGRGDASRRAGDKDKARNAYKTYLELAPTASAAAYARQQMQQL
jgi:predicted RNA polymerase sigma factor